MANLRWLRVPRELQQRRQWCVSTLEIKSDGKPDKAPRSSQTGALASVTNPDDFCTFEQAINAGYPAIGFVLTDDDPYCVIDLDNDGALDDETAERQISIYENCWTYAERSQMGLGLHIVCRAKMDGGVRRDSVEIYDQKRYIIFTGDVVRDVPINDGQEFVTRMVAAMGGTFKGLVVGPDTPERYSDNDIIAKLLAARNADKFRKLYYSIPTADENHSELDASLAQMLAFYSRNKAQCLRLFRKSALYRPHAKYKNPEHYEQVYLLDRTFAKAWSYEAQRDADTAHGAKLAAAAKATADRKAAGVGPTPAYDGTEPVSGPLAWPEGLVGELAQFIYHASYRPVVEIAVAGALTIASGLFGRQFNVSNTGLNLYVVLLAETGRGKEAAAAGADLLMAAIRAKMPGVDRYQGPGHIASGQALVKHLANNPNCFSFLGEFGHLLKIITSDRASGADIRTKQVLLDIFAKSGKHQSLKSSIYSDTDKNTAVVSAPCFSFMGDTTPDNYYSSVSSALISEGLIPRFLTISYDGPRVPLNTAAVMSPAPQLVDKLTTVLTVLFNMAASNTFCDVAISGEAQIALDLFNTECDAKINAGGNLIEMWNRAHLKAMRVAAILAVGRDIAAPVMSKADVDWALGLIEREMTALATRFAQEDVGDGEDRQSGAVIRATRHYLTLSEKSKASTYKVSAALLDKPELIPYGYYRRLLKHHAAFKNDRRGFVAALKSTLQDAVELGELQRLSDQQITEISLNAKHASTPLRSEIYTLGVNFLA